ncbi:hypothetical protein A2U01_0061246 [Trifolium medium]|uniref:Uncharacterized protein n=1 Tax=Trifolium medium TaxID=97028 RepID=A0A392RVD3_9FABA|nr:hypothetical protein [Trifolium medium]
MTGIKKYWLELAITDIFLEKPESGSLAGREKARSLGCYQGNLAPASNLRVTAKAFSLGEEELAGRAHAEVFPIYRVKPPLSTHFFHLPSTKISTQNPHITVHPLPHHKPHF